MLFIGTQYSNLYTAVDTPAEAAWFHHDAFSGVTLARAQSEGLRYLSTGVWLSSDTLILKTLPDVTRLQESSSL